jgi:K+-sensing histidine kinase KdpD
MNKFSIGVITAVVTASVMICVAIQHGAGARLRRQDEAIRQRAEQLTELSAENDRLSNLILQVKNSGTLSKEQLTDLLSLRNEVRQLRENGTVKARLQETNARLREVEAKAKRRLAEAQVAPNYWPKEQLAYAGYSDPESCMKSILTAMRDSDVSSWRQSCTTEAVAQLEKEWKEHGISEAGQEAEIKAMGDMLVAPSSGFRILDQKMSSPDEAVVNLSFDGEGAARKFVLRKVGDEWKVHDLLTAGQEQPTR